MNAVCKEEGGIPDRPMLALRRGAASRIEMLGGIPDRKVANLPRNWVHHQADYEEGADRFMIEEVNMHD